MIIAALAVGDQTGGNGGTISSYTSTPSLTWTELLDLEADYSAGNDVGASIVYATNASTTSLSAFGRLFQVVLTTTYLLWLLSGRITQQLVATHY